MSALGRTARATLGVFRIQFAESIQYRVAALSGAAVSILWSVIEITVYIAFFRHGERAMIPGISSGMTLAQAISYAWLGQMLFGLYPGLDGSIVQQIEKGDIGVEMCRPFPLYNLWFARKAASTLSTMLMRGSAVVLFGFFMPGIYRLGGPTTLPALLCALLSLCCAFVLSAAVSNLVAAVRMNVPWGNGPMHILFLLTMVLSGGYLPLQLWPDFMQTFLYYQPFAGFMDIPLRLYLGLMPPSQALSAMLLQLGWTAAFIVLGNLLMRRHLRSVVIQGG